MKYSEARALAEKYVDDSLAQAKAKGGTDSDYLLGWIIGECKSIQTKLILADARIKELEAKLAPEELEEKR